MLEKSGKHMELVEDRRRMICRGAMKILCKKKFHDASMREIADATGMSMGNFYHYIEKKSDILVLLYRELMHQISDCVQAALHQEEQPVDRLVCVIRYLFDLACRMKSEALVILTEARSLERKDLHEMLRRESELVSIIEEIIREGIARGSFRCEKPHLMANLIVYNLWIVPLRGWNILQRHREDEVREQVVVFILKELGVPEGRICEGIRNAGMTATTIEKKKRKERGK